MTFDKKLANAAGGKTARACDNCIRKRARWFCAADDAFLCQACDTTVHSANPLASRHERVRLKTASHKPSDRARVENFEPSWHQGFTRKPRTRRPHAKAPVIHRPPLPFVPEVDADDTSHDENESSVTQTVPIFEPLGVDGENKDAARSDSKALFPDYGHEIDDLRGFFESEMDLEEFAADVESLLGKGLHDHDSFGMEALGLLDCEEKDSMEGSSGSGRVKAEDEEDMEIYVTREPFELNFDYDSPANDEENHKMANQEMGLSGESGAINVAEEKRIKKKISLRLNHEAVIAAWTSEGIPFPWTAGERPDINAVDCWPDFMGGCQIEVYNMGRMGRQIGIGDGGREARVSRYREKRRTRLFSKKIRYEVRKLNAEKRPRMKGRFVKRTTTMTGCYGGHVFP